MASPLPTESAEFIAAARTSILWVAVLRHAIPVIGVVAYGWSVISVAVFFLLESWLFVTTHLTLELTVAERASATSRWQSAGITIKYVCAGALLCGVLVGMFGGVPLVFALAESGAWQTFLAGEWKETSFLFGLVLLLVDAVVDAVRFARRLVARTDAQRVQDDRRIRMMFYRVAALMMASVVLGLAGRIGLGSVAVVLAISITLIWFELMPDHALRAFDRNFHGGTPRTDHVRSDVSSSPRRADLDKQV